MNAKIVYEMAYGPNPFASLRKKGQIAELWVLWRTTIPEAGTDISQEPIAIFNLDSEARTFMAHIFAEGLCDKLVRIPKDLERGLATLKELRK